MKKRILLLIPNLGRGGAQNVFRQQAQFLSEHFEVIGCVFNWDGSFESDRSVGIVSLNVNAGKNVLSKIINFFIRVKRLKKVKQENRITISISHLEGADYVNILSKSKDKIVCWMHGTKIHDENITGLLGFVRLRILMPLLYQRADRLVTVSNGIAQELVNYLPELDSKIVTIYNGVDIRQIRQQCDELISAEYSAIFQNYKIIITHCRLSAQKNLKAMLNIFNRIRDTASVKLIIAGDGELRDELLSYAHSLGLRAWIFNSNGLIEGSFDVYFIGQQQNPFKYISRADLYLMTSGWEGFPLSLCEALVCSVPIISADCFTGPREILAPGLNLPQPVMQPYRTNRGVIMPMAEIANEEHLRIWSTEVQIMLNQQDKTIDVDLSEFNLSNNRFKTTELLLNISK